MPGPLIVNLLFAVSGLLPAPLGPAGSGMGAKSPFIHPLAGTSGTTDCAGAQQAATEPVIFGDLDKNRNNYWDREEVSRFKSIDSRWDKLDKDGNGRVSRDEFNEYLNNMGPILLSKGQIRMLVLPETPMDCATRLNTSVFAGWASVQNRDG